MPKLAMQGKSGRGTCVGSFSSRTFFFFRIPSGEAMVLSVVDEREQFGTQAG
jgi:hypothetical protein